MLEGWVKPKPCGLTVKQVITRAAAILRDGRWIRGSFSDENNGYCILGAIYEAASADADTMHACASMLALTLDVEGSCTAEKVVNWNDEVCQDKAEAIAKLEHVAAVLFI